MKIYIYIFFTVYLTGLISETPVKPAPFSSTVAARKHVEGTASAVKLEFIVCAWEGACTNIDGGDDEWSVECEW